MDPVRHANFPLHLVQRSRRGAACFHDESDCRAYLRALKETAARLECAVHAYALMGNHVHLLVTPARGDDAARLMRGLAERHALSSEDTNALSCAQTGSKLVPRVDASPVHARRYVLACMRYIELNPVRAGLVRQPAEHHWSSFRANALGEYDPLLKPHPIYFSLGRSPMERCAAYRALFVLPETAPSARV